MAERRPLVVVGGEVKELPTGDSLPGAGGGVSGDMEAIVLSHSGTNNINASSTNNLMPWDTELLKDSAYTHSTSTNNSRVSVDEDARYLVTGGISCYSTVTSIYYNGKVKIRVNGSTVLVPRFQTGFIRDTGGQDETTLAFSLIVDLSAGDYIELLVDREATSGGSVTLLADESSLSIVKLKGTKGATGDAGADGDTQANHIEITASTTLSNATHAGATLIVNSASAVTLTVDGSLPVDFQCTVVRWGAGSVTLDFTADSVNDNATPDITLDARYKSAYISQWQEGDWLAFGDISIT